MPQANSWRGWPRQLVKIYSPAWSKPIAHRFHVPNGHHQVSHIASLALAQTRSATPARSPSPQPQPATTSRGTTSRPRTRTRTRSREPTPAATTPRADLSNTNPNTNPQQGTDPAVTPPSTAGTPRSSQPPPPASSNCEPSSAGTSLRCYSTVAPRPNSSTLLSHAGAGSRLRHRLAPSSWRTGLLSVPQGR